MSQRISAYYLRVSTNRQEKEETIDSQRAEVESRIKEDANILKEDLRFEDEGWSGDLLARPALDAMRDAAAKKEFEVLYIWDRDRIGRKFYLQELVLEELEELKIEVADLHGSRAETPEDKILLGFKGLFAEYEKVKIVERMRRGKIYKARNGKYMNLQAPYGYTYVSKAKDQDSYLLVNEEEAEVVGKIFNWIANEGLTIRKVIKRLNEEKIYPRRSKRLFWNCSTLGRLIRNGAYIGTSYFNKSMAVAPENPKSLEKYKKVKKTSRRVRPKDDWIPQNVPPIISQDLFDKVQRQLQQNLKFNPRRRKAPYLLTGLVYCECGRRRIGEGVREHRYYRCTDRIYNFPLPRECQASGVNALQLDAKVWEKVTNLFSNEDLIKKYAEEWMGKRSQVQVGSKENIEKLGSALNKLKDEEKRYLKVYGSGLITLEQLKDQVKEVKEKREKIEAEIKSVEVFDTRTDFDLSGVGDLTQSVVKMVKSFDLEKRRAVVQQVLTSVIVGNSNVVLVKGVIPLSENLNQKVGLCAESRDSWVAKRGEVHVI